MLAFPVDRFQRNVDVVEDQGEEKVPRDNLGPALVVTISLMDLQWTQWWWWWKWHIMYVYYILNCLYTTQDSCSHWWALMARLHQFAPVSTILETFWPNLSRRASSRRVSDGFTICAGIWTNTSNGTPPKVPTDSQCNVEKALVCNKWKQLETKF